MPKRKEQTESQMYQFDITKVHKETATPLNNAKSRIPKIGNRQIPLHNFGNAFNHKSLLKDKNYRSKVWYISCQKSRKQEEGLKKVQANRPVRLLRQYLDRKERHSMHPFLINSPQEEADYTPQSSVDLSKTTNDFRIRKGTKKNIWIEPHTEPIFIQQNIQATKIIRNTNKGFATFNSKNLYDMSIEQLEESIAWKKQFLHTLTSKDECSKLGRGFLIK